jgi:hypothetical protein
MREYTARERIDALMEVLHPGSIYEDENSISAIKGVGTDHTYVHNWISITRQR